MRRVCALFLVLLLSVPAPAVLAMPTQYGDSGLISQPSADTHQSGSICVGLWSNYSTLKQGAVEESTLLLPVSITLGLGSFIEAYGSYPNLTFNGDEGENITAYPVTGYSDRGFANLGLKTRILGSRSGPFRFAIDGQARRNVSDDPAVDGLTDYLARGIMTLKYGMVGLHANGGYLFADKETDSDHLVYGGGIEFIPTPRLRFMAEYETIEYDGEDSLLLDLESPAEASFGIQYHFSPHLALSAAYAQGLSDYSPDWRTIVGFYTCQGTGTYIKPVTSLPEIPEEEQVVPEEEPVKMLKLNTLTPLATLSLPGADTVDPVSEFEVPVKAGEEEIVITPSSEYRIPEGVERTRDAVDATPAESPDDDEAIPFTTVMAATAGAAVTQVAPLPVAPAALSAPDARAQKISGGRSYAMREYVYDGEQVIGQKVEEELDYKTYFLKMEPQGDYLIGEFYHDAERALPVWVEGPVNYDLSFETLKPFTLTRLKVKLSDGHVPAFKLHIGDKSEVFQFGPPEMWQQTAEQDGNGANGSNEEVVVAESVESQVVAENTTTEEVQQEETSEQEEGDNLAVKIGKGILLAPVAVVAAPFAGAAYLVQKATESGAETATTAATSAAAGSVAASGAAAAGSAQATASAAGSAAATIAADGATNAAAAASGSGSTTAAKVTAAGAGTSAVTDGAVASTAAAMDAGSGQTAAASAEGGAATTLAAQGSGVVGSTATTAASAGASVGTLAAQSATSAAAVTAGSGSTTAAEVTADGAGTSAVTDGAAASTATTMNAGSAQTAATGAEGGAATTLVAQGSGAGSTAATAASAGAAVDTLAAQIATTTAAVTSGSGSTTAAEVTADGAGTSAVTDGAAASTATTMNAGSERAVASDSGAAAMQSISSSAPQDAPTTATQSKSTGMTGKTLVASAASSSAKTYGSSATTEDTPQAAASQRVAAYTKSTGPIPAQGQTMKTTVYRKYRLPEFTFELGLSELSSDGKRALAMVMDRLRKLNKWFLVRIDGHTDSTGPADYNERLAMERAISVASHLVGNEGLNPEIVFLKGFGERKPYETNATQDGRQANRRIELLVLLPGEI